MTGNQLENRLDEIRQRFASKLDAKFKETDEALPLLSGSGSVSLDAVGAAYRRFHEICGTGRTLGFNRLGEAAGRAEAVLLEPYQTHRALTDQEVTALKQSLEQLRAAAATELQSQSAKHGS